MRVLKITTVSPRFRLVVGNTISTLRKFSDYGNLQSADSLFRYTEQLATPVGAAPVPIAWRKWLSGSTLPGNNLPTFLATPKVNQPAVYEVDCNQVIDADKSSSFDILARSARQLLDRHLHVYGSILFRGIPLKNSTDYSTFCKRLGYKQCTYQAGVVTRKEVAERVMTASDSDPPGYTIEPHNEMAYLDNFPSKIMFYCDIPATTGGGGENALANNREILQKLDSSIVEKIDKLGVTYYSRKPSRVNAPDAYNSWQQAFLTDKRNDVQTFLEQNRHGYEWKEDGTLVHWRTLPAFRNHPITGEKVWFNQITIHHGSYFFDHPGVEPKEQPLKMYPHHTSYGDGSEVEPEVIQHIRDVHWQSAVGFQMQKGDLLVLDNMLAMHSRIGFNCDRRMLVALTED